MNSIDSLNMKLLPIIAFFAFSCQNYTGTGSEEQNKGLTFPEERLKGTYLDTTEKNLIFKKWLVDTLKIIDTLNTKVQSANVGKIENVIVSKDSLDLSVVRRYAIIYPLDSSHKLDVNLTLVLSLLDQYGELPKSGSKIQFDILYYYTVSPVPQLSYDLSVEIKRLLVIDISKTINSEYSIVNGRLDHKIVTFLKEKDVKKTEYIDFIWNNDMLVKKRRN